MNIPYNEVFNDYHPKLTFADKLKLLLQQNPNILKNKGKFSAIGYIFNNNPNTCLFWTLSINNTSNVTLYNKSNGKTIGIVNLSPFSNYSIKYP